MRKALYKAVDAADLIAHCGRQCSPHPSRGGYVIGPGSDGRRWVHVASCHNMVETRETADRCNKEKS